MLSPEMTARVEALFVDDNPFDRMMRSRMVEALIEAKAHILPYDSLLAAARLTRDTRYGYLFSHWAFRVYSQSARLTRDALVRLGIKPTSPPDPLARERALVRRCANVATSVQEALDYIELGRVSTAG